MTAADAENTTRLDDADALIWAVERDPRLASTMSSIVLFDSIVDVDALRVRLERTTRLVVRMRQRVVGNPASLSPPRWEIDPDFDLDNHLHVVVFGDGATMRTALDRAAPFIAKPFDRSLPLFEFLLMQGIDDDRSALVMKAHHAIADGMGMLQMQLELFDFEPDTVDPELPTAPTATPLTNTERLNNAVGFERHRTRKALFNFGTAIARSVASGATGGPSSMADQAIDTAASAAQAARPVAPMSPILTDRSAETWHDTISIPVADLKAAGKRANTRLNAAFVAGVARGLGLFHEKSGERCDLLRMGMPINARPKDGDQDTITGNHLIPIRVEVPLWAEQPAHLIEIIDALINAQRNDPTQDIIGPAQQLLARLPSALSGLAFAQVLRGSDFLTSNLPGSPVPMWLGSAKVLSQHPFGPTSAAAVNVTLLSYLDTANIGVSVDPAATDKPELLAECLREGFVWATGGG